MNSMNTTKTIAAMPTTGLRIKLPLAAAALVLALLAIPHAGHAQGVVGAEGGAQQGEREGAARQARWAPSLAARSAPVSAARWAPSMASSELVAIGITVIIGTTIIIIDTALNDRHSHFHCYRQVSAFYATVVPRCAIAHLRFASSMRPGMTLCLRADLSSSAGSRS